MDYERIARLGRGGMGVVDLARDPDGNRVALKRLTLHGSAHEIERARQRLIREANVLSRLHHPNIVRLIEVVEEGDEVVLVMPYLSAGSLADRVAQHGPAPPADVERLGERLLRALEAAHQAGVIHRDIKPGNVLYDADGEPMLADFGLAHSWDQTHGLTVTGMVVGTPGYMPPEQARDEPLTPASDVFSVGATLLYAATGTGPYGNGDPALLMVRAAGGEVEPLPKQIPKHMRGWLSSMLDPAPEYRPTATALLTGQGLPPRRFRARLPRGRTLVVAVALAAALGTATWLVAGTDSSSDDQPSPPDEDPADSERGADNVGGNDLGENDLGDDDLDGSLPFDPGPDLNEDPPATDLPPGEGGPVPDDGRPLQDEATGRFATPQDRIVFDLPPVSSPAACQSSVRLYLELDGSAFVNLSITDETGRELDSVVVDREEPGTVSADQSLCPEPGEMLQAELAVVETGQGELGGYVVTREDG